MTTAIDDRFAPAKEIAAARLAEAERDFAETAARVEPEEAVIRRAQEKYPDDAISAAAVLGFGFAGRLRDLRRDHEQAARRLELAKAEIDRLTMAEAQIDEVELRSTIKRAAKRHAAALASFAEHEDGIRAALAEIQQSSSEADNAARELVPQRGPDGVSPRDAARGFSMPPVDRIKRLLLALDDLSRAIR